MNGGANMFFAKYDAIDVAEYVLWYCENELNKAITNLQLQKILYYIQGEYLAVYKEPLFDNGMEAWDYGPVIPDVYYEYNQFVSDPITGIQPHNMTLFNCDEVNLIRKVILKKAKLNVWKLVKDTHNESPWKKNFERGLKKEIPISDLQDYFIN